MGFFITLASNFFFKKISNFVWKWFLSFSTCFTNWSCHAFDNEWIWTSCDENFVLRIPLQVVPLLSSKLMRSLTKCRGLCWITNKKISLRTFDFCNFSLCSWVSGFICPDFSRFWVSKGHGIRQILIFLQLIRIEKF